MDLEAFGKEFIQSIRGKDKPKIPDRFSDTPEEFDVPLSFGDEEEGGDDE